MFFLQKYLIQLSKYAKKKVKFNNVINLYSYSYNFLSTKKFFSAFKQFFFHNRTTLNIFAVFLVVQLLNNYIISARTSGRRVKCSLFTKRLK